MVDYINRMEVINMLNKVCSIIVVMTLDMMFTAVLFDTVDKGIQIIALF